MAPSSSEPARSAAASALEVLARQMSIRAPARAHEGGEPTIEGWIGDAVEGEALRLFNRESPHEELPQHPDRLEPPGGDAHRATE